MEFSVKQARLHAGLTQKGMADRLRCDRSTYRKIENDVSRATVKQILMISRETGIPVCEIFLQESSTKVEP